MSMLNVRKENPPETPEVIFFHLRLQKFNDTELKEHQNNTKTIFHILTQQCYKGKLMFSFKVVNAGPAQVDLLIRALSQYAKVVGWISGQGINDYNDKLLFLSFSLCLSKNKLKNSVHC